MRAEDLEITATNPEPRGGQHVGTPHYHIKVLHKPTGIYAVSMWERSQHKNKQIAMAMVEFGLAELGWKDLTNDQ
ncbi:MAG: peptide chain release factor-like protein [Candidatus Binatia bacterium]